MPTYAIGDRVADDLVRYAYERVESARLALRSKHLAGQENAETRARLRARIGDYERTISGLNTGEGVTRRSAT